MIKRNIGLALCFAAVSAFAYACGGGDTITIGGGHSDPGSEETDDDLVKDPDKEPGKAPGKEPGKDPGKDPEDPGKDPGKDPEVKPCSSPDEDGDTISDELEGKDEARDSDGDGIPDYLDLDSDNDTIPDKLEAANDGCSGNLPDDSLGIGIPNYLNDDSDGNGILDTDECCGSDEDCLAAKDSEGLFTYCIDSDEDGKPDFSDDDNDGDGIEDSIEITGENTGLNSAISISKFYGDCNGDGQPDDLGSASAPIDCDGDTIPDYLDTDSDGDGLDDSVEAQTMVGNWFARYSKDSDGNGISDAEECGVSNVTNIMECRDLDNDGIPDVFDIDNDGDGLSDVDEVNKYHTSMDSADSDNDGVEDFVEIAVGTSPTNAADNPQAQGNFVFIVPYKGESTPKKQSLSFETSIQTVDMFFAFDQSASMSDEVASLKSSLKTMLEKLQCKDYGTKCNDNTDCKKHPNSICSEKKKCIVSPSYGEGCFDSMYTGTGFYHYFNTFWVGSHLNEGYSQTVSFLEKMFSSQFYYSFKSAGNYEVAYQAPICAAYGPNADKSLCDQRSNYTNKCDGTNTYTECNMNCSTEKGRIGCVGYRSDAIRIFVHAFDENQCYALQSTPTSFAPGREVCEKYKANVGSVLKKFQMRYVGLYSNQNTDTNDDGISNETVSRDIATKSGSLSTSNQPFVYLALDSALADKAAQGIREISRNMPLDVTSAIEDVDKNASQLIKELKVDTAGGGTVQNRICAKITNQITGANTKTPGISKLLPGSIVCYDVYPVEAQTIFPAKSEPQLLKAKIKISGDGSVLNSGIAYFVVPPVVEEQPVVN